MDSGSLISTMNTATCLEPISLQGNGRAGTNRSIHRGGFLFRRRRSYAPIGIGCGTRRVCVQAVETSSKPNDAASKKPFVEPQWLFSSSNGADIQGPSDENRASPECISSPTKGQTKSVAFYYIVISTSTDEKSTFSEPNSGILLSLIGDDGNAFMHKIPGIEETNGESSFRFQRGGVDAVTLAGPDLGRLSALWVAPEAGTWRLEKATVTILQWIEKPGSKLDTPPGGDAISSINSDILKEMASTGNWKGVFHLFKSNEELLGKDVWLAAAQLKPSVIQEALDLADIQEKLLQASPKQPKSSEDVAKLREESMQEYENLKLSLLGFTSLLVALGTASLAALSRGDLAEGFVVGGVGGFLYLLLLQRAVDQLASSATANIAITQKDGKIPGQPVEAQDGGKEQQTNSQEPGRSAGTVTTSSLKSVFSGGTSDIGLRGRIAVLVGVALVLGRLAGGGAVSSISPPQLLAGVVGFLTSRVAVVLVALKPTSSPKDKEIK